MSVPVVICDDSSFARKQVARALPKGWDVDITYATNGREGVEAIAAGHGDVLFLDLTMPEMDGFEALEYIREHDLQTLPIVISGDIQSDSHDRVKALGAVAFIKKPVDAEALSVILDQYGVLDVLTGADQENSPTVADDEAAAPVDFYDWCQEISNVAMGRAADLLATVIAQKVELSIPKVNVLEPSELNMMLQATTSADGVFVINQGFIGRGISGETMIFLEQRDLEQVAALMGQSQDVKGEAAYELVIDVSNILVGAFLKGVADQLGIALSQTQPEVYIGGADADGLERGAIGEEKILAIDLRYTLGDEMVSCDQLLLFTESSQQELRIIIDYLID